MYTHVIIFFKCIFIVGGDGTSTMEKKEQDIKLKEPKINTEISENEKEEDKDNDDDDDDDAVEEKDDEDDEDADAVEEKDDEDVSLLTYRLLCISNCAICLTN
jgi:phosphopantothenoylcysteine synthetase/decarboxylase